MSITDALTNTRPGTRPFSVTRVAEHSNPALSGCPGSCPPSSHPLQKRHRRITQGKRRSQTGGLGSVHDGPCASCVQHPTLRDGTDWASSWSNRAWNGPHWTIRCESLLLLPCRPAYRRRHRRRRFRSWIRRRLEGFQICLPTPSVSEGNILRMHSGDTGIAESQGMPAR